MRPRELTRREPGCSSTPEWESRRLLRVLTSVRCTGFLTLSPVGRGKEADTNHLVQLFPAFWADALQQLLNQGKRMESSVNVPAFQLPSAVFWFKCTPLLLPPSRCSQRVASPCGTKKGRSFSYQSLRGIPARNPHW